MSLTKKIKKYWCLSVNDKKALFLCLFFSAIAHLMIRLFPLKLYFGILKNSTEKKIAECETENLVLTLEKAMKRVRKVAFWDCSCLNQVLTLKILANLKEIPATVKLEIIDIKGKNARAHASLIFNDRYEYLALTGPLRKSVTFYIN